mgnify:CR=1 FL=1
MSGIYNGPNGAKLHGDGKPVHIKNQNAVALGALGGRANTEKQNAARRLNGRKGGRPKGKMKIIEKRFKCLKLS